MTEHVCCTLYSTVWTSYNVQDMVIARQTLHRGSRQRVPWGVEDETLRSPNQCFDGFHIHSLASHLVSTFARLNAEYFFSCGVKDDEYLSGARKTGCFSGEAFSIITRRYDTDDWDHDLV